LLKTKGWRRWKTGDLDELMKIKKLSHFHDEFVEGKEIGLGREVKQNRLIGSSAQRFIG